MPGMIFKRLIVMSNDFIRAKFLNNFDVSPIFSIYDLFNMIPLTVFAVKVWTNPRFKKRLSAASVLSLHIELVIKRDPVVKKFISASAFRSALRTWLPFNVLLVDEGCIASATFPFLNQCKLPLLFVVNASALMPQVVL